MKKETGIKNKKWLWIAGIAAVVVIVGVVLGIVFGLGGNGNGEQLGGRPDLYWNADRSTYLVDEGGIASSSREPAADGLYYIRFAYNGEYVEYPVADKKLVNFIDGLELMSLVFDKDGMIVDAQLPNTVAVEVGFKVYVQETSDEKILTNSSISMNGLKNEVILGDLAQVYNVSSSAKNVGEIIKGSELELMDNLYVYSNKLGEITHVFMFNRPEESAIYWRCEQMYADKKTTRVPDENGVYTINFYCDGEIVELKFKDEDLVTTIDSTSRYSPCFSFSFDEDGYVKEKLDTGLSTRTVQRSARYDITSINDNLVETTKIIGSNAGVTDIFRIDENTIVYDASNSAVAEGRGGKQVEGLQVGDRIVVWSDANGVAKIVYISNRIVDVPAYYVPVRKYSSALKETTREPVGGRYEIELLREGDSKNTLYWTEDKALMTKIDADINMCVGLKVTEDNEILAVYDVEALFGNTSFCRGRYVMDFNGIVGSFATITDPDNTKQGVLGAGCKIYNVSTVGEYGAETTLQQGDYVYAWRQPTSEIIHIYISKRKVDYDVYYNLTRKYDSKKLETTRESQDGWYIYTMALNGKQVTVKTDSREMATFLDSVSPGMLALSVDSNGVIKDAQHGYYATGGRKRFSGYFVKSINNDGTITVVADGSEKENILKLTDTCEVWNVSEVYQNNRGEAGKLQIGDKISALTTIRDEAQIIYIRDREVDNMYINPNPMYADGVSTRQPDGDGWYWYELAVNGELKTFKTDKVELANKIDYYGGGFGMAVEGNVIKAVTSPACVKGVSGSGVTNWDVTSINGNKVVVTCNAPGSEDTGTSKTLTLASNVKIYDTSPTGEKYGAVAKLKVGDRIRTYLNNDGETLYIYIRYQARPNGAMSYCEHCDKVVFWNPWVGGSFSTAGGHFYLVTDVSKTGSCYVGRSADYGYPASDVVLDLNGNVYCRTNGRAMNIYKNASLTVFDSVGGGAITAAGTTDYGGVILVSSGTLNLHEGVLTLAEGENRSPRGGVVYMTGEKARFNMYGGKVTGGETVPNDTYNYSQGGNVFVNGGVFNMYGGIISKGLCHDGSVTNSSGKKVNIYGYGGNVYARGGGNPTVNIYGGTIENGVAYGGGNLAGEGKWNISDVTISGGEVTYRGGNIYTMGGTWNVSNVVIKDGVSANRGGNVYVYSKPAEGDAEFVPVEFNFNSGVVKNGKAGTDGDNFAVVSDSILNILGGTVSDGSNYLGTGVHTISGGKLDGLTEYKGGTLTLTGTPVLTNLSVASGKFITLGALTNGADITVDAVDTFTKEVENAENYIQYFHYANEGGSVGVVNNALAIIMDKLTDPNAYEAYCEHCKETVQWNEWAYLSGSGHYYLADGLEVSTQIVINEGEDIIVDLKGQSVVATDVRAFSVKGALSIVDSTNSGAIISNGLAIDTESGGVILVNGSNAVFNLYSGTVALADQHNSIKRGGVAYVTGGASFNVYGGTIVGGVSRERGGNITVVSNSSLNIYGGAIIGGTPFSLYIGSGTHTISGGEITGDINYADGTLTVSGEPKVAKIELSGTKKLTVGQLTGEAKIIVDGTGVFTNTIANANDYVAFFEAFDSTNYEVAVENNALAVVEKTTGGEGGGEEGGDEPAENLCPCGCGTALDAIQWTDISLEDGTSSTYIVENNGHYRIANNVRGNATNLISIKAAKAVVDLNGKTIENKGRAFYHTEGNAVGGSLYIVDTVGTATITTIDYSSSAKNNGGLTGCWIATKGNVSVYGGTWNSTTSVAGTSTSTTRMIYIREGSLSIYGGTFDTTGIVAGHGIMGGYAETANTFNISGGTFIGGEDAWYFNAASTVSISGGDFQCQVNAIAGANVTISGNPTISDLKLNGNKINLGEMAEGALITVNAAKGTEITEVLTNAASYVNYFEAEGLLTGVIVKENKLVVADICPCGCGTALEDITWIELSGEEARTNTNGVTVTGTVHYRLVGNYTNVADTTAVSSGKVRSFTVGDGETATKMIVDLNGYKLENTTDARIFQMSANASLFILDSRGGGTIQDGSVANSGGFCYIVNGAEVNMYGGRILPASGTNRSGRGPIYLYRGGTFNLYGGIIDGCTDTSQTAPYGGVIYANANSSSGGDITINVYGGIINSGLGGDSIYMNNASKTITLNMEGGQINGLVKFEKNTKYSITLMNAPVIANLDLSKGAKVTFGELTEGASIAITAGADPFSVANENAQSYVQKGYVSAATEGKTVEVNADNQMVIVDAVSTVAETEEVSPLKTVMRSIANFFGFSM